MIWRVITAVYLGARGYYGLSLITGELHILAVVNASVPPHSGDILYPLRDALYRINHTPDHTLKVLSATQYSDTRWECLLHLIQEDTAAI